MPRPYPPEFRRRATALVKSGRTVAKTAIDLDVTQASIYAWIKQDWIDRGEIAGLQCQRGVILQGNAVALLDAEESTNG